MSAMEEVKRLEMELLGARFEFDSNKHDKAVSIAAMKEVQELSIQLDAAKKAAKAEKEAGKKY